MVVVTEKMQIQMDKEGNMINDSTSKMKDMITRHEKVINKLDEEQTNLTYEVQNF